MADIYDVVIRSDLGLLSTQELKSIVSASEDACAGLAIGMKIVGELTFHALNSDDYTDQQAREHLSGLSDLMMYLPRIVNGIQQNLLTAKYEISRRGGAVMISKLQFNQLAEQVRLYETRLTELEQVITTMQRKHSIPEGMSPLTTLAAEMGLSTSKAELLARNCGVLVVRQGNQLIVNESRYREAANIVIKGSKRKIGSKYWYHPLIGKFIMTGEETGMTAQAQTESVMSDALFSCVYRWINGHTINEIDTIAAMQRHKNEDPLSLLAIRLKSVSPGNTGYDRMCDQGYIQTDNDKQREKRTELVLEFITPESLNGLLADTDRLNRLFPPEPTITRRTKLPMSVGSVGYDARQDYVIKGYLPALSLCSIYGPSGSYKSFLAVSWACHIASGKTWSGKRVSSGAVLYVVGEGGIGVPRRIKAWEKVYNGDKPLTSLYLVNRPVFPVRHQEVDEVLLAVQNVQEATGLKVELIVLDTLARCFGGSDENDARDMGAFIEGCDTIKRKAGATVLVVHHSGKDETKGARGSSAFRAALDAEFNIKREDENKALVLTCTKMKDAEEPQRCAYDLRTTELFHDEDDELISSLVVMDAPREVKENDPALAGVARLSDNHVALWQSVRSRTAKGEACTRALLRDDLKVVLGDENVRKGFGRWLEKLKSEGLIEIDGENITPLNSD